MALLDENNNGFLMNSVHSSDGNYCYIKEIVQGNSSIELSGDEQNALNQALSQSLSPRISRSEQKVSKTRSASDERTGRNPATGEAMTFAASNTPVFKPAKAFKEKVN